MSQEPPVQVIPLSGGIRRSRKDDDPFLAADTEALTANCGEFTMEGGFFQHGGVVPYTTIGVAGSIVWMKRWYKDDGTKYFLALSDAGVLYRVSDAQPATFSSIHTGLSGEPFTTAEINGWLYLANGIDPMLRYDGTSVFVAGAEVPALGAMSLLGVSGGTLEAGTYLVAITYEYGFEGVLGESNLSAALSITIPANFSINVFNIPVSPRPDVTFKGMYRTLKDGDIFYFIDRIPNAQTTYTFQAGDPELSVENFEAETNHDLPNRLRSISAHKGRIWGIDQFVPNRIRLSLEDGSDVFPDDPEYFSDELTTGDGERVVGTFKLGESLFASKKSKIWVLNGDRNENFFWEEVPSSQGFVAEQSIRRGDGVVYGLGQRDMLVFDGIRSLPLEKVRGLLDLVDGTNKPRAYGVYRDKKFYLAVQTGASTRRALLLMAHSDPTPGSTQPFPISTIQRTGFEVSSFESWANENDRIFIGGYDGRIYEFDLGVNWAFTGEPVGADFQWKSNWLWINNAAQFKRFIKAYFLIESEGGTIDFTYDFMTDDPNTLPSGSQVIDLNPVSLSGLELIGRWDQSRWG